MTKGTLEIHSENILPIIKKWLYSDRDIFVRELVSNGCDAIQKYKIVSSQDQEDFRVDVTIQKQAKTITFSDNGIGMDAEEVQKYIAQIAFSGAEDFVQKYQSKTETDQFIGHFGLGFYSAYMVADKVELETLSYKEGSQAAFWSCDGSTEYVLQEGKREKRGTDITLFINKESEEFLEASRLKEVLKHYCSFLPFPVYLGEERINAKEPLWMKPPSECDEKDYLEFYNYLYPFEEPPLFWMHLNVDYPFHLKGILYFPSLKKDFDFAKHTVKLYCNRVFVSDNCKDVIPEYLMVLRGVIDSPDIPLNVSRSYLQVDHTVRQLSNHISKKVSDSLSSLFKSDRPRFETSWRDISPIIKLGAIQDDKFYDRVKDLLIWKTTEGQWLTLQEYLDRNGSKIPDKVIYAFDEKQAGHLAEMHHQKQIDILTADFRLDPYLFQALERKNSALKFKRIDAEIADHLIDKDKEKTILDAEGKTEAARLADFYRHKLEGGNFEVEAKSLATADLPALVVIEENERRMRDYMQSIDPEGKLGMNSKRKVVLNTNNALVSALPKIEQKDAELAKELAQEVIDLSLLSQRELNHETIQLFVKRTTHVLEKLTLLVTENQP